MVRYNPDVAPREPIKPLRLKDEHPGGLLGALRWFRGRGIVFWFFTAWIVSFIGGGAIIFVPIARTQGQLDFRSPPDMTIAAEASATTISPGDTLVYTITHENLGESFAGAVTVDIVLPNELTAVSVVPGTPACSQATDLERFSATGLGDITGEAGGIMKCLLGTRTDGSRGTIVIETLVGAVSSGAVLKTDIFVTTEQTRGLKKPEKILDNNYVGVTVTVR